MAIHCSECSFINPEGASYCAKCGAFLGDESTRDGTTATYQVDAEGDLHAIELDQIAAHGEAVLVIRAGGGRSGESFALGKVRMTVGRRPDSDIFLDDVTVSRDHALIIKRGIEYYLDDCGSLNGTYVNRARIESRHLSDGDELQIGKYRLTFLVR